MSTTTTTTPTPTPPAGRRCPRCGTIDARAEARASRWVVTVALLALLSLMWHPLLALLIVICGIAFALTTRRRICPTCGFDGRDDARRGFDC